MTYDSLLIHTCYSGTSISSQNSLGEWKLAWTYSTVGTTCRASPITASQKVEYVGLFDDVSYILFLPSSSHYSISNRVIYENNIYKIRDIRFDSSHHHRTALIAEIAQ